MNNVLDTQPLSEVDYDPFAQGGLAQVVPVTQPQREIWLADRLGHENSLAYNMSISLRLNGALDVAALCAAVRELPVRHESLRATVSPDGESLCIDESLELDTHWRDLADLDGESRDAAVEAALRASVETPFDLEHGPLFRAELLRIAHDEHLLILTAHHIVCDGWSWGVIAEELGTLYARQLGHSDAVLPEPDRFADYALGEAAHGDDAEHRADEAYWLQRFADEVPVLELPTDRPRPSQRTSASARVDRMLDASLVSALRTLGARHGATLFATLLGGFAGTLSRLAGQSTVVVGIPAAGQAAGGHGQLVGHCVSLLPLRFDLDASQPFAQVLQDAQATLFDAMEHQRCTFGALLKTLRVQRDPSRLPLVSVIFNLDRPLDENLEFPGLTAELVCNPRRSETFELSLNAVQTRGGIRLEAQYNTALFDAASVEGWLRAFEVLLRAATEAPSTELGRLPMLDEAQRIALEALQPAPTAFDRERRMHEHVEMQADRTPDRIALRFGDATCTYAALEQRANRIARLLRARGVRRGDRVGLALDRGIDMVAAMLGILKSGAGYVPLDPKFPAERLAFMTDDSGIAALLTWSTLAPQFDLHGRPVLALDLLEAELVRFDAARPGRDGESAGPEDVAYVIYTSGSTGRPKGVKVPHRAVANLVASMQRDTGLSPDDRVLAVTTLSFDVAVLDWLWPLSVGCEVIVADRDTAADGRALAALLASHGATVMQATPATWRMLVDSDWAGSPHLRILTAGEPLAPDLAAQLLPRCAELWNYYGPTETTVYSTGTRILPAADGALPDVHIGRPVANTQVWILDARGEPCLPGVPGEMCIGGEGVTHGYHERPELTAEKFIPDRFAPPGTAARLYRTGDRGRWRPDGNIEHLGRLDHQVKVRGFRIEPGEIETNLMELDGIARALVVVREDRPGDQRLVAYLVAAAGMRIDDADVRAFLRARLPPYMVPQHFIVLAALPLLPNGKVDRSALPAPGAETGAATQTPEPADERAADPRVRYLGDVWTELLGLRPGPDDNFFDLGGHSMLAVQMVNRVARETGVQIKLIRLGSETLAGLAADLPEPGATAAPASSGGLGHGLRRLFGLGRGVG